MTENTQKAKIQIRRELKEIAYGGIILGRDEIVRDFEEIPYIKLGGLLPTIEGYIDLGDYIIPDSLIEAIDIFTEANGSQIIKNRTIAINSRLRSNPYVDETIKGEELEKVKDKLIEYIVSNYSDIKAKKVPEGILFYR